MKKSQIQSFIIFTSLLLTSIYSLLTPEDPLYSLENHFTNCEYEQAIILAEKILKDPKLNRKDKLEIYIIKGVSEYSNKQVLDSKITFAELLHLNGSVSLDSREISPKIIEVFNNIKENKKLKK